VEIPASGVGYRIRTHATRHRRSWALIRAARTEVGHVAALIEPCLIAHALLHWRGILRRATIKGSPRYAERLADTPHRVGLVGSKIAQLPYLSALSPRWPVNAENHVTSCDQDFSTAGPQHHRPVLVQHDRWRGPRTCPLDAPSRAELAGAAARPLRYPGVPQRHSAAPASTSSSGCPSATPPKTAPAPAHSSTPTHPSRARAEKPDLDKPERSCTAGDRASTL
jgi:hypothetical protein